MSKLREKGRKLEPVLRIGKNGLSDGMLKEIISQLEKKRNDKIKDIEKRKAGKEKVD